MERWFLDTSFLIALASRGDRHHAQAIALLDATEMAGTHLVTTDAVLLELGGALSRVAHRRGAATIIRELRSDARVEVVALVSSLMERALELFGKRDDKEWSLADCIAFEVMRERGVMMALTADAHFEQAGFVALLRPN